MTCRGSIVADLNQSRNGATCWDILMTLAFACIVCYVVAGIRKWEFISEWNRDRRSQDARGTETLSVIGVSWGRRGCLGERRANKASISAAWDIDTYAGVIHSGCTTTVAGSGAFRHTTSSGFSPNGKVDSLSSRDTGVVLDLSYTR